MSVAVVVGILHNVFAIVVFLVRNLLIAQWAQITVHVAPQRVAHRIHLVGPRPRCSHELRRVAVAGLLD